MVTQPAKYLFTVDEYYRMAETGILPPDRRVELIEGEIYAMTPIGSKHFRVVMYLSNILRDQTREFALVSTQGPLRLSDVSEPEPDVVLLKPRKDYYGDAIPSARDALLIIEVSDTTLAYDRDVKVPLYAESGVPEVWVVDIPGERIHLFRDPSGREYRSHQEMDRSHAVSPLLCPEVSLSVQEVLG